LLAAPGQAAFDQAVAATRPGGRIVSFAATSPGETVAVDLGRLTSLEKDVLTAYSASVDLQQEAAELVFGRTVRVAELVSHVLPVARGLEAMALAAGRAPGTLKVMLGGAGA
jgi:threonine dehydrogenase-like Zn-dependent dehydrogenase